MDATKDLFWIIGVFIAFGILWVYLGGPNRDLSNSGIRIPAPVIERNTHQAPQSNPQ